MSDLSAEEAAAELKQEKKRSRAELTGDEHKEEPEGKKKCSCTELAAEMTCQEEEKKMKTTRKRYSPEYIDYILSWYTDSKIPELSIDDEMTEEVRSMHLHAMEYWRELRARKKALQEFVKAQVEDLGYAKMREEDAEPPRKYYDDDGEELVYLGFGIYDE